MTLLSQSEKERYARHISLKEIGLQGQEKLKKAKVLIVGIGGLGSALALYLSAAGVGSIGLMDDDMVSESNLQRQVLYNSLEIGESKVEIAKRKLSALNPHCRFTTYNERLNEENASEIIAPYDIVLDGCDNLPTRYIIDKTCHSLGKIYVYGSIAEFTGQLSVFNFKGGKSYSELFPYSEDIKTISQAKGVMGVLPGIVACLQVNEVLKIICDFGEVLSNKLLLIDTLKNTFNIIKI